MSKTITRRVVAGVAATAATAGALIMGGGSAEATPTMAISSFNVHHLPATTAKSLLTITGTAFSESAISGVAINGCTAGSYVVTSSTTIVFKTDNSCAKSSTGVVTISKAAGGSVVSANSGKTALAFVDLPSLATNDDSASDPVVTAGTAGQAFADQTKTASLSGGQAIRVTAGTVKFVNSASYPLSATVDGYALKSITMPTGGNYFTGVLPAMAADAAPKLAVTSNGVTKTFSYAAGNSSAVADSFDFQISASPTISVTPASGPLDGTNVIAIKGSGFTASTTVTVDSASCPVVASTVKATSLSCTVAAGTTTGPVTVQTSTGGTTSIVSAGSTYTYVD
ncbi:IPT/TIG domain-containing protein [Jatrophihabitans endophyticus]|uniref:IPT/TIG domain-containing protein n=1 Tax=Jatrophihabitans endophyticus TaxID=1206085 RepID=A0A1M5LL08_9ACTN|nr:IPT/TIG domain-containing protein [Jatrophihabitans endophyticus]SHG65695.1 IPT/TIG domain-containing protein [Jatrophihabitans endophyticus]